jgi:5-methylcytosine-specific restriction endonuclease McrA
MSHEVTTRFKEPKTPTMRRRKCRNCGQWFTFPARWLKSAIGAGQYCSKACTYAGRVAQAAKKPSTDRYGRTWRKADREWSKAVRERDGYVCQWPGCGVVDEYNHAHHRLSRAQYPHRKYDVTVGVTLCPSHHRQAHGSPAEARKLGLLNAQSARYELERKNKRLV